jgi:hypothetical protein
VSAILDRRLLEAPLSELTAVEVPMAILLRRRSGELNESEATHAAIINLADCVLTAIESGSCYEAVTFINAMADTIPPDRRIRERAVEIGTAPDLDNPGHRLVFVMGESGYPVSDPSGRLMVFSLTELHRLAALSVATQEAVPH